MRITFSQLLITLLLSSISFAKDLKAQDVLNHKVNITVTNSSLELALKQLEKDAGVKFVYSKNIVKTDQKITYAAVDKQLKDVLSNLLVDRGIAYQVINDHIVLNVTTQSDASKKSSDAAINALTVKGKVVDNTGFGLPGVSVKVKGTATAVATDNSGNYTINVPDGNGTLEFSYVGFDTQEIAIAGKTVINVTMSDKNKQLNEVVVIGYGTQKRGNVTGAVATLKGDNLDERAITRVDQALVGQLAGVTVKQTTGVPGKAFSIQVRGTGSISAGNEPLYVLDGFPLSNSSQGSSGSFSTGNPLDNINPNDIESIQVLKDAAAAAIYGSRASNGVVLITTKKGQTGKPKVSFNTYAGYNQASKKLKMLNGDEWIDRSTEIINTNYLNTYAAFGATAADSYDTRRAILASTTGAVKPISLAAGQYNTTFMLDPRWAMPGHPGLEYVDWQDAIEQKGIMQNDEISVSGGTDAVKYFISGNYSDQDGFVKGLGYKAYSARANVEANISKAFKMGLNIAPSYSITEDPGVEGKDNIFHQALSMSPVQEASYGLYPNVFNNDKYLWSTSTNSPLAKLENNIGETKRYRTIATIYGEYQILKNLSFRSSLNLDNTDNSASTYNPYTVAGTLLNRTFDPTKGTALSTSTSGTFGSYRRQTFVNENTLTYNQIFDKVHSLNVLVGQSYNVDHLDRSAISSNGGFTSSVIQTLGAATAVTGSTNSTQSTLVSYFTRVQYSYKDKYLLSASLREDGSSRFGPNNKYGVFPSASVGWRMIDESFMKKLPVISDFKLRASVGVNGNNNIGDYSSIPTIASYGYVFGSTPGAVIGQAPNVIANPDIKWERSTTYDVGLDFGLIANRITGSFDYYNKLNTDLLLNVPVPETTGQSSYLANAGSVRNTGLELELTSRNLIGKFQWNTSVNISHNTNKVVSLSGSQTQIIIPSAFDPSGGHSILQVGQPLYSIYAVKQLGILTQTDINNKVALSGAETAGDPKYEDYNHDGVIDNNDRQIVGHPTPDYTWGVTNTFKYKGFDLSVLVQGQNGGSIYSLLGRAISRVGQGQPDNAPEYYTQRWRSESDPGAGKIGKQVTTATLVTNTDWLYSSNYFRVRDITLGYNLKNIVKTPIVQGARIYVTAENFFGHDKYYGGLNPEAVNTTSSSNSAYPEGADYGGLPLAKSLIFGLNFTF